MAHLTSKDLARMNEIRVGYARWAGSLGVGTALLPGADIAVIITTWTKMLIEIADVSGHEIDTEFAKKFAWSVAKGTLLYVGGSRIFTSVLAFTGFGTAAAMATNGALNYGYTWLMGGFLIQQFSRLDFDTAGLATAAVTFLVGFEMKHVLELMSGAHAAAEAGLQMAEAGQTGLSEAHTVASALDPGHLDTVSHIVSHNEALGAPLAAGIRFGQDHVHFITQNPHAYVVPMKALLHDAGAKDLSTQITAHNLLAHLPAIEERISKLPINHIAREAFLKLPRFGGNS